MKLQDSQSTSSPAPGVPRGFQRCQARNRDRSQCRLHAQDPATGLCSRHALRASQIIDKLDDSLDLADEVLATKDGAYQTTDDINAILSNVVTLVAQGRISPRRAAVITFALSLMLRSVVVMDRRFANSPAEINLDNAPRPIRDPIQPETAAAPGTSPSHASCRRTGHEAAENYARPRT
jgi:hypothetical protein